MTPTSDMFWQKLNDIEKKLDQLITRDIEHNIDEVSLSKASKLIRRSSEVLLNAVKNQELYFMSHRNSRNEIRYRFRVCDLYDWQKRRLEIYNELKNVDVESTDEMIERIFGHKPKRRIPK